MYPGIHYLLPAECEEPLCQFSCLFCQTDNMCCISFKNRFFFSLHRQKRRVSGNTCKYIIKVMGNASCKLTDRLHLLGKSQLILKTLQFSYVCRDAAQRKRHYGNVGNREFHRYIVMNAVILKGLLIKLNMGIGPEYLNVIFHECLGKFLRKQIKIGLTCYLLV